MIVSGLVYLDDALKAEGEAQGGGDVGNSSASGIGDAVCRRCGDDVGITA